ncbi:IclR family transcriptional regulator [Nonomuraea guangzhouensis]|uniref:IclR family transcriptional regulator n=1 Tax=Nonomuraea guangzhouensis TaxID=1291555 RepID=A0ABW4FY31_9ACTN|nr:IclR family transcriptional regulator [Nonomuraea guangzhouensis]
MTMTTATMSSPSEQPDSGRSVASRVLSVLDAFSGERRRLTLSDISRRTRMPLTTAHRLVGELVSWGALERDRNGRYQIGLHLWEVAALAPRGLGLREVAMPFLEELFVATRQHVQLAVLDDLDVVYIERISSRDAVGVHSRVGGRWPAHTTGVGLVLLAYAPRPAQERYLASPLATFTKKTIMTPDALRRVLAEVRRTGYAVSDRQVTLDAVSVAAPVRDAANEVVAALSVVVRADGDGGAVSGVPARTRRIALPGASMPGSPQATHTPGVVPAVLAAARGISLQLLRDPERP